MMIIKISQNQIFIVLSRVTVVTVLNVFLLQRYCLIKLKKKLSFFKWCACTIVTFKKYSLVSINFYNVKNSPYTCILSSKIAQHFHILFKGLSSRCPFFLSSFAIKDIGGFLPHPLYPELKVDATWSHFITYKI